MIQLRDQQKTNIEEVFFKSFFKEKQKVFFQKRENSFTSYHSILSSELTISAHSNLSYEAMLLERKSLLMPLKFSQFYKNSSKSFETDLSLWYWTIYEENYENFEDKVDQLLNTNNEKYFLNTKNQSNYIINSDDNEETLLRKTILNLV